VMVRVSDINSHHDRAKQHGARILRPPPTDYPYGERQYTAEDSGGIAGRSLNPSLTLIPKNGVAHLASCRPPWFKI